MADIIKSVFGGNVKDKSDRTEGADNAGNNIYWQGGKRYGYQPDNMDQLAQQRGYASAQDAADQLGYSLPELASRWGGQYSADGSGGSTQQVADSEYTTSPGRFFGTAAAIGAGGGLAADYLPGLIGGGATTGGGGGVTAATAAPTVGGTSATIGGTAAGGIGAGTGSGAAVGAGGSGLFGPVGSSVIGAGGTGTTLANVAKTAATTGGTNWGGLALSGASGLANALLQNKQANNQSAQSAAQLAQQQQQFDATLKNQQGVQGLAATQMNPLAQQQSRQRNAIITGLLANYKPATYANGQFSGGAGAALPAAFQSAASTFDPSAIQGAEDQFTSNAKTASGGQYTAPTTTGNPTTPAASRQVSADGGIATGPNDPQSMIQQIIDKLRAPKAPGVV